MRRPLRAYQPRNKRIVARTKKGQNRCELQTMPYFTFLNTKYWRALRRAILKRDRYRCRQCGGCEGLEVHHKTYARRGREKLDDLLTLCYVCHEETHEPDREGFLNSLDLICLHNSVIPAAGIG